MKTKPTSLGRWLQGELEKRKLNQLRAAAAIGIGTGTLNDIIRRGHVPKIPTLFRIADYFDTPREKVLRLAANLPPQGVKGDGDPERDYLIYELVEAYRKIPDEFKLDVLQQVRLMVRITNRPAGLSVGDDDLNPEPQEPVDDDEETQDA